MDFPEVHSRKYSSTSDSSLSYVEFAFVLASIDRARYTKLYVYTDNSIHNNNNDNAQQPTGTNIYPCTV